MRFSAVLVTMSLLLASCSDSSGGGPEFGASGSTSSTTEQALATSVVSTTQAATSLTTVQATATSDPTSLVIWRWGILGTWDGQAWDSLMDAPISDVPAAAGDIYRVIALDGTDPVTVIGESPSTVCEPVDLIGIPTAPPLDTFDGMLSPVAVRAEWDIQPRDPIILDGQPEVYIEVVSDYLAGAGLANSTLTLEQVIRVDLEGDGVDEVLIVAESTANEWPIAAPGDYSVVLLRKVIQGDVETAILSFSFVEPTMSPDEFPFMQRFRLVGLADLNGDSKLEIIVESEYYEGAGAVVYEYVDDDMGPVAVIGAGCGA